MMSLPPPTASGSHSAIDLSLVRLNYQSESILERSPFTVMPPSATMIAPVR